MSSRGSYPVIIDSFIADAAITQYSAVMYSGLGRVKMPTSARVLCAGIAQDSAAASGDVIPVLQLGKSKVRAAASASIGDHIAINDVIGYVSKPAGYASGDCAVGYYEEAPGASGDLVTAFINIRILSR